MSTIAVDNITDNSGGNLATINGFTPGPGNMTGRNKIINGKMEIAQRGTSFSLSASSSAYTLDRWLCVNNSASVQTVSQQADVPSDNEFQSSLRCAVTTADTSIAAGDLAFVTQAIEGFNARDLIGRTFTISFRVRSSKTGIHCVSLRNSGDNRSYVAEYTINAANTWETKTITVNGGLITAGTWDWTNGVGLRLQFVLAAGTNSHGTAGSWQTGLFFSTANQVNCLDTVGNIFAITGVQLEVGSVATPFEHRPFGTELALCQRYFQAGIVHTVINTMTIGLWHTHQVSMRVAPTITATFLIGGTSGYTTFSASTTGFRYFTNGAGSGAADYTVTVSAEL